MNATALLQELARGADELLRPGGYLLVSDGEGFEALPESLAIPGGAHAQVRRVGTELHLRHALWQARGAPVVAVVPPTLALPADLREGAARRRVHVLSGDEILSGLLGTRVIGVDDAELRQLALDHLDQIQARLNTQTTPTVIDRKLLERTLIEVVAELHDLGLAHIDTGALLAKWVVEPPKWGTALIRLAQRTLTERGDPGRLLAWALDDAGTRMRALLVHGAVLSVDGDVSRDAWGPLAPLLDRSTELRLDPDRLRDHVVYLATGAVKAMAHRARPLLDDADGVARRGVPSAQLAGSDLLPLAFRERAHRVAVRLGRGEVDVRADLARLAAHALAPQATTEIELLEEMARLARYLAADRPPAAGPVALAVAYATDHAFADLCARRLHRALAGTADHHAEARALLDRVYTARDALNRAWATGLAAAYTATLFDRAVVPLQKLARDVVGPRLTQGARAFVLVLDGCSVPVFLDLLDQLASPQHAVGLEADGMRLRLSTGLSPLPTITSHARGALFLGQIPKDPYAQETVFRDEGERKTDPARFQQNKDLGNTERRLFLKGDLADGGRALIEALRGPLPLVAAVFNAVDDRIGSHDTGQAWRLQVEDVHGLVPALKAAVESGRKVLVTADHGHSPFRGTALRVGAGSAPRFVRLDPGVALPDGFIEVDCADLSGEPGRYAFAWRSGVYLGQPQVGFHGGCSLEEMVVPVAWLAGDGRAADRPTWWHPAGTPRREAPPPVSTPVSTPRPEPTLFAPAAPPSEADVGRLPAALRAAVDDDAQRAIAWILAEGPIRTSVLADKLGRPAQRVRGWLAKLGREVAPLGVRLVAETLPDHEIQWRYEGPEEGA